MKYLLSVTLLVFLTLSCKNDLTFEQAEKYVEIEKKIDTLNTMVYLQQDKKDQIILWEGILDSLKKQEQKIDHINYLIKDYKDELLYWRNKYYKLLEEINYNKKVLELSGADVIYTKIMKPV